MPDGVRYHLRRHRSTTRGTRTSHRPCRKAQGLGRTTSGPAGRTVGARQPFPPVRTRTRMSTSRSCLARINSFSISKNQGQGISRPHPTRPADLHCRRRHCTRAPHRPLSQSLRRDAGRGEGEQARANSLPSDGCGSSRGDLLRRAARRLSVGRDEDQLATAVPVVRPTQAPSARHDLFAHGSRPGAEQRPLACMRAQAESGAC